MRPALLALLAAVLAAPTARAQEAVPPPPATVVPPLPAALVPPPAALVPPPRPFDLLVGVDALLGVGSTPAPNLGAGVFIALRHATQPAVSVEVTGRASWSLGTASPGYIGVKSTFWSGQLALCAHGRFAFLCHMIGVGQIEHKTLGALTRIDAPRPLFAIIGARLGLQERLGQVLVRGFLEVAALPGSGRLFHFNGNDQWRPSVGGVAGIGFALLP